MKNGIDIDIESEEFKRTAAKGRRWFKEYISKISEGMLSDPVRKRLTAVLTDICIDRMAEDPEFYNMVQTFVNSRRTREEKEAFFRNMLSGIVSGSDVRELYAKRYPQD